MLLVARAGVLALVVSLSLRLSAMPARAAEQSAANPASPAPAALAALIAAHAPADSSDFLQEPGDLSFQTRSVDAAIVLDYQATHRVIGDEERRFLEAYFERAVGHPEWSALYRQEILCREGEARYWMPISEPLLGYLIGEVKGPAKLVLHLRLAGAYRASTHELVNVILVNDFSGSE